MTVEFYGKTPLSVISNGHLKTFSDTTIQENPTTGKTSFLSNGGNRWCTHNPINLYDVTFYIGDYAHWHDTIMGEKGMLDLDFYALKYNEARARKQFAVVKQMLHCYEYWMGPYPFYEDGYKLVEAPYLGMEHQSAIAYGNKYKMGYLGTDRSGTGLGMDFDYIIIHESGHEWFGNNITTKDEAEDWVHEGFTTYVESLFEECLKGREAGFKYTIGEWQNIRNDAPIIGPPGVNEEGSGDRYDKGAAIVYMIRRMMNDDEKFRQLLRGLNRQFWHQTVTSAQVEQFISDALHRDLWPFFNQYLRTTNIPELQWYRNGKTLFYRFANVVPEFELPVTATSGNKTYSLKATQNWQFVKTAKKRQDFTPAYLVNVKKYLPATVFTQIVY